MIGNWTSWLCLAGAFLVLPQPLYLQRWQGSAARIEVITTNSALSPSSNNGHRERQQSGPPALSAIYRSLRGLGISKRSKATPAQCLSNAAAMDLLAACLQMGLPIATAIRVAAPVATVAENQLMLVARAMELGADTATCWTPVSGLVGWSSVGRLAQRSAQSGAALAKGIGQIATDQRSLAGDQAEAAAERAGVLIAGPLALCFLPAFVILGLVPAVIGLAEAMELSW